MRDLYKTIGHIERATWKTSSKTSSAPRAASAVEREAHRQFEKTANKPAPNTLIARAVKLTVPLSPAAVAALDAREGGPSRIRLTITFDGGTLWTEVAAKSVRKAQKVIAENGPEAVFCTLQGKLVKNEIVECGLVAQVKATSGA